MSKCIDERRTDQTKQVPTLPRAHCWYIPMDLPEGARWTNSEEVIRTTFLVLSILKFEKFVSANNNKLDPPSLTNSQHTQWCYGKINDRSELHVTNVSNAWREWCAWRRIDLRRNTQRGPSHTLLQRTPVSARRGTRRNSVRRMSRTTPSYIH